MAIEDRKYFYRITIFLNKPPKTVRGIRHHRLSDIDTVFLIFQSHAYESFPGRVESVEVVQVPSHLPEVKAYIVSEKKVKRMNPFVHPRNYQTSIERRIEKDEREKKQKEDDDGRDEAKNNPD